MKRVESSGGLAFGDQIAELDAYPFGERFRQPLQLADIVLPERINVYTDLHDHHNRPAREAIQKSLVRRDHHVIMLVDAAGETAYRLRWRDPHKPTQALERVAEIERSQGVALPAWLLMSVYCAARLYDRAAGGFVEFATQFVGRTVSLFDEARQHVTALAQPLSDDEIARAAADMVNRLLADQNVDAPAEPLSLAKTLFAVSRLVWQPEQGRAIRDHILASGMSMPRVATILAGLGALWLWPPLSAPKMGGAKVDISAFSPAAGIYLWPHWLALLDATEDEARALMTPFAARDPGDALIEEPPGYQPPPVPDPALAHAMARQMALEAEQQAVYAPQGVFDALLPPDLPLAGWGIARLRMVALRPGRLWIALLDARGQTLAACPWRSDGERSLGRLVVPDWAWPSVDLAAAALWRDLCVAGPEAAPAAGRGASQREQRQTASARARGPGALSALMLPRPRRPFVSRADTARAWGDDEERRVIRERVMAAHRVRGHYRRHEYAGERAEDERAKQAVKQLRAAAAARAAQFGLPAPPPGFTFVSPFIRGGAARGTDAADGTERVRDVRARGLAALSGVLGTNFPPARAAR